MKSTIIALSLISSLSIQAAQVKSECSAVNENRQKIVKVSVENQPVKKSAVAQ